jgi:flagellar protein FlaI
VSEAPVGSEEREEEQRAATRVGDLHAQLPPPLQERIAEAPHLLEYLQEAPIDQIGIPEFYPELNRKHSDLEKRNLIYPVAADVFVHLFEDPADARDNYVSVEPSLVGGLGPILERMERRLLEYVEPLERAETPEAKAEVLVKAVEDSCVVVSGRAAGDGNRAAKKEPKTHAEPKAGGKIRVTQQQLTALKYVIVRDKIGMGALQPLIKDPYIEDISCSGLGPVFIEHKIFKGLRSNIRFDRDEELDDFVLRLSAKIKKPVTYKKPIVDATLPDGSRINIVYGGDVSKRGTNFTIRKFTETPLSILDIIEGGAVNYQMAAYLWLMVSESMNVWVSGETASGKTTLLNALSGFIQPWAKIVTIEDTPELQVPHPNWIREVGSVAAGEESSVTMFTLLKAALRQRPNSILVGEIRGEEGAVAFQAMQTGHSVMSTFHASTVEKLIQRLTGAPINVPKAYIDNLNVVVVTSAVRLPSGKRGRRVVTINEIIDYDSDSDAFSFIEVFRWNSAQDVFEFTGSDNSYLLEQAIAPRRGIDAVNKRAIYDELDRRADLLQRLHESGKANFYDLYQVISRAQREGLL